MQSVGASLAMLLLVSACTAAQPAPTTVPVTVTTESPAPATTAATTTTIAPATTAAPSTTTTTLPPLEGLAYEEVAGDLPFPIALTSLPGSDTALLATKDGVVWLMQDGALTSDPVLDIRGRVTNRGEQGLLGLVQHPEDRSRFYVHYTDRSGDTVVSEFKWDGSVADPDSERVLLEVDQPASNHNGGMLQFGPDGMLYLGLGDGGAANDRFGNGQNPDTLLAGLVAIDVESGEARKVMSGLRNPWRFWIDGENVVIADVGQNAYEEISVAPLDSRANFGWPITEGLHCFRPSSGCDTTGLTLPIVEVRHGDGGACSITGGIVYRGSAIPEMNGRYFYSDYCGGWLRSVDPLDPADVLDHTGDVGVHGRVGSFGIDGAGEMYVLTTTTVIKVVPVR